MLRYFCDACAREIHRSKADPRPASCTPLSPYTLCDECRHGVAEVIQEWVNARREKSEELK